MPPFISNNMGLTIWDTPDDYFDGSQMAANWQLLDDHDHDQAHGRGKQISSAGLADGAVSTPKIADNAVTPSKIPDKSITETELALNSVGSPELQDNSVTSNKIPTGAVLGSKIDPAYLPVGSVIMWYRPNTSVPLPSGGWEIMDGRAWNTITNDWGVTTGNIPDMRNKFALGAALAGIGTGPTTPPDIGAAGGSHTRDLTHGHTVADHMHSVDAHHHTIAPDGAHKHRFLTTVWDGSNNPIGTTYVDAAQRGTAVPGAAGTRESFYVPDLNRNQYYGENVGAPMETVAAHTHGGITGDSGSNTSVATGLTTGNWSAAGMDFRPGYVGLLFIMRVRNV